MPATEETLRLLRSIDDNIKKLVQRLTPVAPKVVASDKDLDGQYGDPVVKFMPRDWTKDSFKGCNMSQCPADLLDMLAETFDYFAEKAEKGDERTTSGKPKAPYERRNAARARGWAKRAKNGHRAAMTQAAPPADAWGSDESGDDWPTEAEIFGEGSQ